MLRIGIDFDNTIIDYSEVFRGLALERGWIAADGPASKSEVKAALLREDGNDLRWQELQAEAYGPAILGARLFDGFAEFLLWAESRGHEVFVVSHKTERSGANSEVLLRDWALRFLREKARGIPEASISYHATRDEKVARIAELKCDVFIDDLEEVLGHPGFPTATKRVLFSPDGSSRADGLLRAANWGEIQAFMKLWKWVPSKLRRMQSGRNNLLVEMTAGSAPSERKLIAKCYPPGGESRLLAEYGAYQLLWENGIREVPEPVSCELEELIGVYAFVDGSVPTGNRISETLVDQAAAFLNRLQRLGEKTDLDRAPDGADSRSRLADYPATIGTRLQRIRAGAPRTSPDGALEKWLDCEFEPVSDRTIGKMEEGAKKLGVDIAAPLPKSAIILSPSDFGFHNTLLGNNGKLTFLDFEYFGWDDPAKLISDFFHSVGQELPWSLKWRFLDSYVGALPVALRESFTKRWELVVDLIGLEWILIVLNVFVPEVLARKKFARPDTDERRFLEERFGKAREMLAGFRALESSGSGFLTLPKR